MPWFLWYRHKPSVGGGNRSSSPVLRISLIRTFILFITKTYTPQRRAASIREWIHSACSDCHQLAFVKKTHRRAIKVLTPRHLLAARKRLLSWCSVVCIANFSLSKLYHLLYNFLEKKKHGKSREILFAFSSWGHILTHIVHLTPFCFLL